MQHLIPFRLARQWFAIEADYVEQILGEQSYMLVPGAPPLFPGVTAWRGRATAVLNLSKLLPEDDPAPESREREERPRRTLIVHYQGSTAAIPADEVREALPREAAQLRPLHVSRVRFSCSEFEFLGTIAVVLDLRALLHHILGSDGPGDRR